MKRLLVCLFALLLTAVAVADTPPPPHKPYAVMVVQQLDLCTKEALIFSVLVEQAKHFNKYADWEKFIADQSKTYPNPDPADYYHRFAREAWVGKEEDSASYAYAWYSQCRDQALLSYVKP
jgi:hypothetical protein